ncbi:MAG: HAD family phosphatase [Rhizobacter sp.]
MIEAIVFDMDGVLVDARDWHYQALNRALETVGHHIERHDHLVRFDGLPTATKLDMLSADRGLPRDLHAFICERKQAYTMEILLARCAPGFGHEDALSRLRAMNYKLAVATNSTRQTLDVVMQMTRLGIYMQAMVSASEVTSPKPDPEIYLAAFAKLGVAPQACLVVEDNDKGVRAARAARAHVLQVTGCEQVTLENILARIEGIEGIDRQAATALP